MRTIAIVFAALIWGLTTVPIPASASCNSDCQLVIGFTPEEFATNQLACLEQCMTDCVTSTAGIYVRCLGMTGNGLLCGKVYRQ
jgi:hypothetical protein